MKKLTEIEARAKDEVCGVIRLDKYTTCLKKHLYICPNPKCKKVFYTRPHDIWTGNTTSCGCLQYKTKDLSEQKFGKLLAIVDVGRGHNSRLWECLCDCGKKTTVALSDLVSGQVESCGNCGQYKSGKKISKQQKYVHEITGGILNYKSKYGVIDIALCRNNTKICVEYYSWFWHGTKQEKDKLRIENLIANDWKTLEIFSNLFIPNENDLFRCLKKLIFSKSKSEKIYLKDWGRGDTFKRKKKGV